VVLKIWEEERGWTGRLLRALEGRAERRGRCRDSRFVTSFVGGRESWDGEKERRKMGR